MLDGENTVEAAIGGYVASFSALVMIMHGLLVARIAGDDEEREALLIFALSSLTAEPITNAFFAACRTVGNLDKDEQAIEACLRKAVLEEIKQRNDIVHGGWFFEGITEQTYAFLHRVKAGSVRHPVETTKYTAAEIAIMSARIEKLHHLLWEFAAIIFGRDGPFGPVVPERLCDALHIVDGRVEFRPGIAPFDYVA